MRHRLTLYGALAVAFLVRLANLPSAFVEGRLFPFDSDPAYHLRRIFLLIHHFPTLPTQDPFLGYPHAAQVQWPPLFDLFCAFFHLPVSLFSRDPRAFEIALGFLIPLSAVAVIGFTYRVTRRLFGPKSALVAAWGLALMPTHVFITMFGRIDHHLFEPLLPLLLSVGVARFPDSRRFGAPFLLSLAIVASILTFPLTYYPYLFLFTALSVFPFPREVSRTWGFVTLLSLGFSFSPLWHRFPPYDLQVPGKFFFLFALLNTLISSGIALRGTERGRRFWLLPMTAGVAVIVFLIDREAGRFLSGVVGGKPHNTRLQGETAGVERMGWGGYAAFTAGSMGIQFFLVPFLAWRLIAGKEERRSLPLLLLASTLGVLFVESLLFARFLPILAVPAAVSLGALWGEGTGRSRTRILAAATIGSLAVSSGLFLRNLWLAEIHYPSELMAALRWIRNETPPATSDSWSETEMPAYGIVSRAGFGGFLIHHAERPALDSPFDTDLTHLARYEAVGIRIARSEREGVKGIRKNRVRYLLTYPSFDEYADLFRLLGREVPGDLSRPNRSSIELLETRLHLMNGSYGVVEGKHLIPALERFRLVYQSEETRDLFGRPFPTFKVFEFVEGAIGKIDPPLPSDAILELELRPEKGETTHYRNFLHRGTKEVRLPYATSGGGVSVRTGPRYRLILPDRVVPIEVSEKASRTGGEIAVPIQGSRRTP